MGSLDVKPKQDLQRYLRLCGEAGASAQIVESIVDEGPDGPQYEAMLARWYDSVRAGDPDFSVYDGEWYLADLWLCWKEYSRKYLRELRKHVGRIGKVESVVDLGCGAGWGTLALADVFPDALVRGTNLEGTTQHRVACLAADQHPRVSIDNSPTPADLLFASEYLEHFEDPLGELRRALDAYSPRVVVLASSFGALAVGHFNSSTAGRSVGAEMRARGYRRLPLKVWNGRPQVYEKVRVTGATGPSEAHDSGSFAALILTHGRPGRVITLDSIRRAGYTGRAVLVLDDEDETADEYRAAYPDAEIAVFDKRAVCDRVDSYTNAGDRRVIVYARNAAFDVARELGIDCFVQLDDDYTGWHHRVGPGGEYLPSCEVRDLDAIFAAMTDFLYESGATTVALAQGGDLLAGSGSPTLTRMKRKAMNSFFCRTDRPFSFSGRVNEDVNSYVGEAARGALFATVGCLHLNQAETQASDGGMSDVYRDGGTYVKSFYTVLGNPSCVKVAMMGSTRPRLHHAISWDHAAPLIIHEKHRKT